MFNCRRTHREECTFFLVLILYHIAPPVSTPNFVLGYGYECEVLVFNGYKWVEPEGFDSSEGGEIASIPLFFGDESFAKAFASLEKTNGHVLASTMDKWSNICFVWINEEAEKLKLGENKLVIHNGPMSISQYLVDAVLQDEMDIVSVAATMCM